MSGVLIESQTAAATAAATAITVDSSTPWQQSSGHTLHSKTAPSHPEEQAATDVRL